MANGPDQPPAGPTRLVDSLARHRWVAAAGMTATVAVVAGAGLALALHDSSSGPPKECGLVPCAAALPASVQSRGDESASAPAAAGPTAAQRASTPPGPAPSPTSPAASPTASPAASATAPGTAPPEAASPAERVSLPDPRSSCTTVIAFTARGALSTPVRCTFTKAVGQPRGRDGAGHPHSGAAGQDGDRAGVQLRSGPSGHDGWRAGWLNGWLGQGWSAGGRAGWLAGWQLVRRRLAGWQLVRRRLAGWRLAGWRRVRAARRLAWRPVTVPQVPHDAR